MKILTNEQYRFLMKKIGELKRENYALKSKALREYQRGFSDGHTSMYEFAKNIQFPNSDLKAQQPLDIHFY